MESSEDQIKELMTTVDCAVCGANYQQSGIEVLGHRDTLWFLRVSCTSCATCGLVAVMVKMTDESSPCPEVQTAPDSEADQLDRAPAPGPISAREVADMRQFLSTFDGNFRGLFGATARPDRPAA